ncbi:MAG: hypothetical protein ACP5QG_00835 [candidate division WOR-3 bacterium]
MLVFAIFGVMLPIQEGVCFGLGFSHIKEGDFSSTGCLAALLNQYPLSRLYDFEHPALFSVRNLHRDASPVAASFSFGSDKWAAAGEGLFALQGDTLTSDRLIHGRARVFRDAGPWALGLGFSYSDFSYRQRTLGSWRNWALDTRTVLPELNLVFPAGNGYLSTTLIAGYAESVGGDVLLPVGLDVLFASQASSVRLSYLTLSNTAVAKGLLGMGADGRWESSCGTSLTAAGRIGLGVGGDTTRYFAFLSSALSHDLGLIALGDYLQTAIYTDDSLSVLAVQDGLTFEIKAGPASLIVRPQATYYSSGQWKYGALGGTAISVGAMSATLLGGRLNLSDGFVVEGKLEVKLW